MISGARIGLLIAVVGACLGASDPADQLRPVTHVGTDSFTIQYFTATACETRAQIRQAGLPVVAWRSEPNRVDPWAKDVRVVEGENSTKTSYHRLTVAGLEPGTRYFYRVFDPAASPTDDEKHWGASQPWRREYAVCMRAGDGKRAI